MQNKQRLLCRTQKRLILIVLNGGGIVYLVRNTAGWLPYRGVEKTTKRGASCSILLAKYYSGSQIQKNDMGKACSTYGGQERCIQVLGGET